MERLHDAARSASWEVLLIALALLAPMVLYVCGYLFGPLLSRLFIAHVSNVIEVSDYKLISVDQHSFDAVFAALRKSSTKFSLEVKSIHGAFFFNRQLTLRDIVIRDFRGQQNIRIQRATVKLSWNKLVHWPKLLPFSEMRWSGITGFITVPHLSGSSPREDEDFSIYRAISLRLMLGLDIEYDFDLLKIDSVELEVRYAHTEKLTWMLLYASFKPFRSRPHPGWDILNCVAMGSIDNHEFTLKHLLGRQRDPERFKIKGYEKLVGKWEITAFPLRLGRDLGLPVKGMDMIKSGTMRISFVTTRDESNNEVWRRDVAIAFENVRAQLPSRALGFERVVLEQLANEINCRKNLEVRFSYTSTPEGNKMPQAAIDFDRHFRSSLMNLVDTL